MTTATGRPATKQAPAAAAPGASAPERAEVVMNADETQVAAARAWFAQPRFDGIVRAATRDRRNG